MESVASAVAEHHVVTGSAIEDVVTVGTVERIFTLSTIEFITRVGRQIYSSKIRAVAIQRVISSTATDLIVTPSTFDAVIPIKTRENIRSSCSTRKKTIAPDFIIARSADDFIRSVAPADRVISSATGECVVVIAAIDRSRFFHTCSDGDDILATSTICRDFGDALEKQWTAERCEFHAVEILRLWTGNTQSALRGFYANALGDIRLPGAAISGIRACIDDEFRTVLMRQRDFRKAVCLCCASVEIEQRDRAEILRFRVDE